MAHWTEEQVILLINFWREDAIFEAVASQSTRSKKIYQNLQEKLKGAGVEKSASQIRSKLKNLKADYKKVKDHNKRSGRGRLPSGKFYDLLDEVLGNRPSVDPPAGSILDSSGPGSRGGGEQEGVMSDSDVSLDENTQTFFADSPLADVEEDDVIRGPSSPEDVIPATAQEDIPEPGEAIHVPVREDDADDDDVEQIARPASAERVARKRTGAPPKRQAKRDRTLKEALDKILNVTREQDQAHRREMAAAREKDAAMAEEELQTVKGMMDLTRMQLEFQREEAQRRERREREDREREDRRERENREREDKKWTFLFSQLSAQHQPHTPHHIPHYFDQPSSTQQSPQYLSRVFPPHSPTQWPRMGQPAPSTYTQTSHRQQAQSTYTPTAHRQQAQSTHTAAANRQQAQSTHSAAANRQQAQSTHPAAANRQQAQSTLTAAANNPTSHGQTPGEPETEEHTYHVL